MAKSEAPPGAARAQAKRSAREQFDKWALSYDRSALREMVFFPAYRMCREEIVRWQQSRGGGAYRLLDVGCGTATLISVLSGDSQAERLVGLDYAGEMARLAAGKVGGAGADGQLHVVQGDSERLPFADDSFDVITCCNSFHHYPHQGVVLRGFCRVLRPGGLLVLIDGFRDNVIGWLVFDGVVAALEEHIHHAPWSELRAMIVEAGFDRLRQRKIGVLAPLLVNVATVSG
jgi:ubiquinone/menaquinone biosynthesis C-methylase UbiE